MSYQFPFSTALLLVSFIAIGFPSIISGVGVSLKLQGVTIANNSLVDIGDLLYRTSSDPDPTNANGLHDQTLVCVTDLVDCCDSPRTVRGDWYYPDGGAVPLDAEGNTFLKNRGPNEIINGQQFYGSVRLFYQWSGPPGKGRFRCELPSADNPNVNQILYANVVDFGVNNSPEPVTISSSGSSIAGESYSLVCSATLVDPVPLPLNIPTPHFEWFFGPNGSTSLPSGVTPMATVLGSGNTYTSTLQFPPLSLSESPAGLYTCQIGVGRLAKSVMVTVNGPIVSVRITTSGSSVLGHNGYTLTCSVSGAENLNPFVTYQWTKDNGTQTQIQDGSDPRTISFTPLRLSDVGRYTCQASISSPYLNSDIIETGFLDVTILIPTPTSVILSTPNPGINQPVGSTVTMTCTVELSPSVDIPVNVTTVWTGPAGFMTTNTAQPVMGSTTTYTSTAMIGSFGRSKSGVYNCTATAETTSPFYGNSGSHTGTAIITVGVYLSLNRTAYANNSIIQITEVGKTDPYTLSQNEGLQCITLKMPCCASQSNRFGEWYFPNGTIVPIENRGVSFYRNRGDDGTVNLNRISTVVMSPTGLFCCAVPDATDTLQRVCATIISLQITGNGATSSIIGQSYTLTCTVNGTDSHIHNTTFQWRKDGTLLLAETGPTLSFSPLRLSNIGQYTCEITVDSMKFSIAKEIAVATIPPLSSVTVTSSPVSPIRPVGSAVTLTCTVELNPAVDIPVTVTTVWTGPAGFNITTKTAQPVMGSTTTFARSRTVMIYSFGRNESGVYNCTATVSSTSPSSFLEDSISSSSTRVTIGVYLSFNRTVYANNSVIQINEIGETDPYTTQNEGLQCITDRMPCCANAQFQAGEWLFPNGTAVPAHDNARSFYTNWKDNGSVNLNLLSSDTLLPLLTGLFCCVVPDASDRMQTVCTEIKLTFYAEISDTGANIAGHSYTLVCNVTGVNKFSTILSYKWTKNNGTLTQVGSNSKTLSFSPLRLSDSGQYTCHVTASSDIIPNMHVANTSSQSFEINVQVPKPTVSLHSTSPNPSLSETSLTLTCTVELDPAVDVPVTVKTAWTGPDGTAITSATRPEMKSFTLYLSLSTFHSIESADSGNYTCTAGIENGIYISASTNVKIVDGVFQLRLRSVDVCQKWYNKNSDESELYSHFIKEALIEAIEHHCKCHFPTTNLLERDVFICEDSPNQMTYRNVLLGTHNFNGTQIVSFIQDWVNTGPLIKIGGNYVRVDSSCPVAIASLDESTCEQKEVRLYADEFDDPKYALFAEHLNNKNISNCFEGCIVRNG